MTPADIEPLTREYQSTGPREDALAWCAGANQSRPVPGAVRRCA